MNEDAERERNIELERHKELDSTLGIQIGQILNEETTRVEETKVAYSLKHEGIS